MTTDHSTMHSRVIPVFGVRKFARQLLIEIDELRSEREVADAKTQRLSEIAHNLVADAKAIQTDHQQALKQLEALGGLSIVEMETRKRDLAAEIEALNGQLVRAKGEIDDAQRMVK